MMFDFMRTWWPMLLFAFNTVTSVVVWFVTRTLATKEDLGRIGSRIGQVEARVSTVEAMHKDAPTAKDFATLHMEMERIRGDIRTFVAEMRGQKETTAAEVNAARDLVVRTERMVAILTEHEMQSRRGG